MGKNLVKGPKEKIPTEVEIVDNGLIYSLPVWCESPATYRPAMGDETFSRDDSVDEKVEAEVRGVPQKSREFVAAKGKGRATDSSSDIDVYTERIMGKDSRHVASGSGATDLIISNLKEEALTQAQEHVTRGSGATDLSKAIMKVYEILQAQKKQQMGLLSKKIMEWFTEPFAEFINLGWGDSRQPFEHSVIDVELEKHMQMVADTHNQRHQVPEDHLHAENSTQGDGTLMIEGEISISSMDEKESPFLEVYDNQLVSYEPIHLCIEENLTEEMIEARATIWVHLNVIKLGQLFGAAIRGCEKEAYALCMKLDQKRYMERQAGKVKASININNTVPKELWNLIFDRKFKDGELRTRGRNLAISHQ
ncbi:uncharacterized protein LOC132045675 [Lycium ferocissimum]|uniref:uncharacterized protein LOC132045675 n=1 Tax=Lycium ferocissimum TaxID=112874 RepID=UPI0028155B34|nr:uncharacterized protein LOC132045675 [Lycium ferocissimum]